MALYSNVFLETTNRTLLIFQRDGVDYGFRLFEQTPNSSPTRYNNNSKKSLVRPLWCLDYGAPSLCGWRTQQELNGSLSTSARVRHQRAAAEMSMFTSLEVDGCRYELLMVKLWIRLQRKE
ncbi:hypothetical protein CDAR_561411 [Caerostris darwini]|uniref:Uncharacterized protein n=1 Tax=Caerostris darwini TaxID=1538125 RepID=A0AAV4TWH3_9ARAC|nr:hypothetical protein CDAR_561411 [Caerostris darwini]